MSNIYDALEQARKEKEGPQEPTIKIEQDIHSFPVAPVIDLEEEMTRLYQSIQGLVPVPQKKIIQFMGSKSGEGTSTIVRELARVAVTKFGKSVLVWDAQLHKPSQHFFHKLQPAQVAENGKSKEKSDNEDQVQAVKSAPFSGSNIVVSRVMGELMNGKDMSSFFDKLRSRFELVLIDSSSMESSALGLSLCSKADGVILVVEAEKTRASVAQNAKKKVVQSGGRMLGMVLNKRRHHIPEFIYKRLL